jgi:hypothetical protein
MKTIVHGQIVPIGLSRRYNTVLLRIPLFMWYGGRYDIVSDCVRRGWHWYDLCLTIQTSSHTMKEYP